MPLTTSVPPSKSNPLLRLGTSSFTAAGWEQTFYPPGMDSRDYLAFYATRFNTVEIDSTFYRIPSETTVRGWRTKTPEGFLIAAKFPQVITHEKVLEGCEAETEKFLLTMELLGDRLGPLLIQMPYFNKKTFPSLEAFLDRLGPYVEKLPPGHRYALEIRNRNWLVPKLHDVLRAHKVALALVDHPWMPRPTELISKLDPLTTGFMYVRWLGDRKGIEEQTKTWDKVIVDRTTELKDWVQVIRGYVDRGIGFFGFANNHYAGHAPATVMLFQELWERGKDRGPGARG